MFLSWINILWNAKLKIVYILKILQFSTFSIQFNKHLLSSFTDNIIFGTKKREKVAYDIKEPLWEIIYLNSHVKKAEQADVKLLCFYCYIS